MEKEFNDFQKQGYQCGDPSPSSQGDTFNSQSDLGSFWQVQIKSAPDILRKSVERFLIGNVI